MKRIEISLLAAILFCSVISMCALNNECEEIRGSVLRLHVLANSDSQADQELKLKVRDRLLEVSRDMFSNASSKEEAESAAKSRLSLLQKAAEEVIRSEGYGYPVRVGLEKCYFGTRTYGDVTLPAGNYHALRVVIGEGAGHNWWCVMFPPLCISPAEGSAELSDVLSEDQMELVESDGYVMKFKCVEIYEELKQYLSEK